MDEREREVRAGFSGLVRALMGYFDHLRLVEQSVPAPDPSAEEDEDDFFYTARAALECARSDHLEPLLRSLEEFAAPEVAGGGPGTVPPGPGEGRRP